MQTLRVYNATPNTIAVAGFGNILTNSKVEGVVQSVTFDPNFDTYATKGPAAGMLIIDVAGLFIPLAESPARYYLNYLAVTAITTLVAANRFMLVTNAGASYAITLPAANALPANTPLYFYYDSGSNAATIARAGSDTINGLTTALDLDSTAPNKVKRVKTDGVSNWTTF